MKGNQISNKDFASLIADAILEETYLDKDKIIAKVIALARGMMLNQNCINFNKIKTPSETQILIREHNKLTLEIGFLNKKIKSLLSEDKMKDFYDEREKFREDCKLIDINYNANKTAPDTSLC